MNGKDLDKATDNDGAFKGYVVAKLERLPVIEEKIGSVEKKVDENSKKINYVYAWAAGVGATAAIGYEWIKSKII